MQSGCLMPSPSLRAASLVGPLRQSPARDSALPESGRSLQAPPFQNITVCIVFYTYIWSSLFIQTFSVYSLPSTEYSLCYYCHAPSCWALLRPHYGSGPERLPLHLHVPANPAGLVGGSRLLSLLLSPVAQGRVIARYAYWQTRSSPECM